MRNQKSIHADRRGAAPILLILIILIVGAVGYFVLNKGTAAPSSPYDKVFKSEPAPVAVVPVKAEISQSAVISEKGGTLTLGDQQEMSLTLPEGALLSPEEITFQGLNSIDQLPEGSRFIAGAELTPDGLGFVKSSTLSIKLPTGTPTENLAAFAYEEGGQNFYFTPYSIEDGVAEIPIDGFSGGGIIDIPALIPIINPGTPEQTAKQLLADVLKRAGGKMLKEIKKGKEGQVDQKLLDEARGILNAWYQNGVKPDLKTAEKDDAKVDGAIDQMISWRTVVQLFGLDEHFRKEFEASLNSAAKAVKHGVFQSDKRCINQKDPGQVVALLRWLKLTQKYGLAGRANLSEEEIRKKAKNCVVFEIHMDSLFNFNTLTFKLPAKLDGMLQLSDDFLRLTGSGTVEEGPFTYTTGFGGCRQDVISYNFTIPDTKFNINFHSKAATQIDLALDLGAGGEVRLNCTGYTGPDLRTLVPWSNDYFPAFHEDELVSGSKNTYFLKNWQFVGSKDIYAQKIYKRSLQGATENTTFTLKHTPRK